MTVSDSKEIEGYRTQIESGWHDLDLDIPVVMLDDVLFRIGWAKGLRKEQLVSWAKDRLSPYPGQVIEDPFDILGSEMADRVIGRPIAVPQIIASIRRLAVESCQSCWRALTLDEIEDKTNTKPQCSPCRKVQMNTSRKTSRSARCFVVMTREETSPVDEDEDYEEGLAQAEEDREYWEWYYGLDSE